ncbi:HAD family hydrolase [Clostridium sp.]|uniref:HAD family hydrolase n=1 Tax=Clostridium sp. TaxID=1506 RepID=UPI003991DD19
MDINAVIFDMDGVIFDTESLYLKHWCSIFSKYGYEMTKENYLLVMGRGRKVVKEKFLSIYGENLPIDNMYKEKDYELSKYIEENEVPIKEGAYELLEFLKVNGYKVALATSAKRGRAMKHLKDSRFENYFDVIITGEDIEKTKPNPEIFLKALERLNIEPKKAIVIEDSIAGIKAAKNAGIFAIHVPDLKEPDEEIIKEADIIASNLLEVKSIVLNL